MGELIKVIKRRKREVKGYGIGRRSKEKQGSGLLSFTGEEEMKRVCSGSHVQAT